MKLYQTEFLFLFLPLFMGVYALLPAQKRPAAVAAADILFLASAGKFGLTGFLPEFVCAYFSGITIYNLRLRPRKAAFRKNLLAANILLYAASAVFFSLTGTGGLTQKLLDPAAVYCHAVVPLHLISYLTDVYRGDCEAQTKVTSLLAYAGFFPSASTGLVLKYKNFVKSFSAPRITWAKLAAGIRLYIFGLAEYLIIGRRLESVRTELISAPDSLRSGTGWLFVPIFFVMFTISVRGLLNIGRGTALMLGFYVRPARRKHFLEPSLRQKILRLNDPLGSWLGDYVVKPLKKLTNSGAAALMAAVCVGALWYRLSFWWLITGLSVSGLILLQERMFEAKKGSSDILRGLITKMFMAAAAAVGAFMEMPSAGAAIFRTSGTSDTAYTQHLLTVTLLPMLTGLVLSSSFFSVIVRRMNKAPVKAFLPVIELLIFILSVSFILNMVV